MSALPALEDIKETFAFLEGWEDRFEYIIDLGKKLPELPEQDKCESNRVHGCQSSVWLIAKTDTDGTFELSASSDAFIVSGLIVILLSACKDLDKDTCSAYDFKALFTELGLEEHLSPTRRNGLYAMIERIKVLTGK